MSEWRCGCGHPDQGEHLAAQAGHLMLIVRELLELGLNPQLVRLDDDGVTVLDMTLTDELSLIAMSIDYSAAMAVDLT